MLSKWKEVSLCFGEVWEMMLLFWCKLERNVSELPLKASNLTTVKGIFGYYRTNLEVKKEKSLKLHSN